jgi:hypothetical protein
MKVCRLNSIVGGWDGQLFHGLMSIPPLAYTTSLSLLTFPHSTHSLECKGASITMSSQTTSSPKLLILV